MKRRDFVKNLSSSVVLGTSMGPYGARAYSRVNNHLANLLMGIENTDRVLVMVFLRGGNDGLNTLVPLDYYSQLFSARQNIIQPENSLIELPGTGLGMHGSMTAMKELYDEEKLCIIQNVGYEDPNFSHFRSTDIWMSGSDSREVINSGWTGRYMHGTYPNYPFDYPNEDHPHPLAIEIGNSSSLLFQGPDTQMGLAITDPSFFYDLLDNVEPPVPAGPAGDRIELIRVLRRQSETYNQRVKEAAEWINYQKDYPDYSLADQLKIVSRLIAGGLKTQLYLVQVGSFDTHANQVAYGDTTEGTHSYLLRQVSESLKAFMEDTEFLGTQDRIMGMVFSEFGRRIKSNNSNGSDHGSAGPMFLFGNSVNPGVIGTNPVIPDNASWNDNLDYEFDYRQVYSSIFEKWLCVPSDEIENSLPGAYERLDIVKDGVSCNLTTSSSGRLPEETGLKAFPTLATEEVTLSFESQALGTHLQLLAMDGRLIRTLDTQALAPGSHQLTINITDLPSGHYFVRQLDADGVRSTRFIKTD